MRILLILTACIAVTLSSGVSAGDEAADKQLARQLATRFGSAKSLAQRRAVIAESAELPAEHLRQLFTRVERTGASESRRYLILLGKTAATQLLKRARAAEAEIRELQADLSLLRKTSTLTKEQIQTKASPAIVRLEQIMLPPIQQILENEARLAATREQIRQLQAWTAQLRERMGKQDPAADAWSELELQERQILLESLPMGSYDRKVLSENAKVAKNVGPEEAAAVARCNVYRLLAGLSPLILDTRLTAAARDHSADMERLNFFSHTSPVAGKTTFADRAQRAGTTASGENIFLGAKSGKQAQDGWFHSPPHHKNMFGSHRRIGVGRQGKHYTELFGR